MWKCFFLLYWRNEFTVSSLHIFICLNSSSSAPSPHTPWMLNLSSYYLFPISLSLSLPSIHLSSALERSLSLFLSKSIFSAVWGLEPYWKHFQCCWLDSSCQAEAETSCRNVDHQPDLQGLSSLPLPQLARLERSNFGNINNAERWWLSKTSIHAGVTRGGAGKSQENPAALQWQEIHPHRLPSNLLSAADNCISRGPSVSNGH